MAKPKNDYKRLENGGLIVRTFRAAPTSINEKDRSIEAVFATESPVTVFDWERYDVVDEVLLMSGMRFPDQIPLLDSHNRSSVKDQLGSARNMRIEGDRLVGRIFFSTTEEGESAWIKAREGHLTDLSIGYVPKGVYVEDGAEHREGGKVFKGPLKISNETRVKEVSLTPIGADDLAKTRSSDKPASDEALRAENEALKAENESLKTRLASAENGLVNANSALKFLTNK